LVRWVTGICYLSGSRSATLPDPSPARLYRCPACGGEADERARACRYCGAPIATVRCASCFHLNVLESLCCSGCGHTLGLEPLRSPRGSALACPACKHALEPFRGGPGQLLDCGRCGGQFVEHALLRELLERREVLGSAVPHHTRRENPLTQPVRYVPCPACQNFMNRRNFGKTSGIIVDMCHQHGTWFDAGELPRVLAFVQSGGLERAKGLVRDERRVRDAPGSAPVNTTTITGDTTLLADLAEAGIGLLTHVTSLLRG
jgi:Zn-finger nucleic acid-binding protein